MDLYGQNLDAMDHAELVRYRRETFDTLGNRMSLGRPHPRVLGLLDAYAISRLHAMRFREAGKIDLALKYEHNCDKIYRQLPTRAMW